MLGPLKKRQILGFKRCIVRTLVEQFVFMKQTAAAFHGEIDRKGDERWRRHYSFQRISAEPERDGVVEDGMCNSPHNATHPNSESVTKIRYGG